MIKLCNTCRHWQASADRSGGICRRNAPITTAVATATGDVLKTVWPSTGPGDYCGEYGAPFTEATKDTDGGLA